MADRKELKIAANIRNQLGKQVTEVRGSEERKNQTKYSHPPADKDNQKCLSTLG